LCWIFHPQFNLFKYFTNISQLLDTLLRYIFSPIFDQLQSISFLPIFATQDPNCVHHQTRDTGRLCKLGYRQTVTPAVKLCSEGVETLEQWLFGPAAINSGMQSQMDRFCFCEHQQILGKHFGDQCCKYRGPGSSVGIADYGLDGPGIESRWGREVSHTFRPALGPTQPPVQWVPGFSSG
jgi:hypothetical protein